MENDRGSQEVSKAVQVCMSYEAMMQDMIQQDFREIIEAIYQANRVFVYGTGAIQRLVAKEIKRLFTMERNISLILTGKTSSVRF